MTRDFSLMAVFAIGAVSFLARSDSIIGPVIGGVLFLLATLFAFYVGDRLEKWMNGGGK